MNEDSIADPVLAALVADAESLPGTPLQEQRDIHVRTVGDWRQHVDIYARAVSTGGRLRPALVCLHGGGFSSGTPASMRRLARFLAWRLDMVVVSANYRLTDRARFPVPIQDAANAVRWLRAQASTYAIDPDRIAIGGESAGGYLAAMVALTADHPDLAGGDALNDHSARVQALIVQWGPVDFVARWYGRGGSAGAEGGLLGTTFTENPTRYHHASALSHVHAGAPPALFVQGRHDQTVHLQQAELGFAAWTSAGIPAETCILDHIGHGRTDERDVRQAHQRIADFLAQRFSLTPRVDTDVAPITG